MRRIGHADMRTCRADMSEHRTGRKSERGGSFGTFLRCCELLWVVPVRAARVNPRPVCCRCCAAVMDADAEAPATGMELEEVVVHKAHETARDDVPTQTHDADTNHAHQNGATNGAPNGAFAKRDSAMPLFNSFAHSMQSFAMGSTKGERSERAHESVPSPLPSSSLIAAR